MKQKNLLKHLFLLIALLVGGVSNAWADDVEDVLTVTGWAGYTGTCETDGTDHEGTSATTSVKYIMQAYSGSSGQLRGNQSNAYANFSCRNSTTLSGYYIKEVKLQTTENTGTFDGSTAKRSVVYFGTTAYANPKDSAPTGNATASNENASGKSILTWSNSDTNVTYFILYNLKTAGTAAGGKVTITWAPMPDTSSPSATLSTNSLDFGNVNINETKDLEFTVTPANLTSALSITCNNDKYEVSPISIAQSATGAQTVTVTAKPTTPGVIAGTITISGGGLTANKTVTLTTTAIDPNANDGSEEHPYTVAEARAAIDAGTGVTGVYATGIVSEIVIPYNSQYHNISYNISADGKTTSDQLQAYRGKGIDGADFTSADDIQVGDIVVVKGNLTKYNSIYEFAQDNQLVSLVRPAAAPSITASNVNIEYNATAGTIESTINNPVDGGILTAAKETVADWLTLGSVSETNVPFTATANDTNEDREATVTLTYTYNTSETVTKDVTITQKHFVVDYATLPFNWAGGTSAALTALPGVTASGLGSDYGDTHSPYCVKFDTDGDYIQIKTDSQPGIVTIGVKMIGGNSASSISVQQSADGSTFTDLQSLSISGSQNSTHTLTTTMDFNATTRYIRLVFNKGSNVGVGPISIASAVVKTVTTTTIDATGITNTDLDAGTAAGQLTASVKAGETPVGGATVTWTSSDEKVATVDEEGNVTLKKKGTTTITASYAGNDTYASSSNTYELTVTSTIQPTEVESILNYSIIGTTSGGSTDSFEIDIDGVTMSVDQGTGTAPRGDDTYIRIYKNNQMTFTAPTGYVMTDIAFTRPGTSEDWKDGMTADVGTYSDDKSALTNTWTGTTTEVTFTPGGTHRIASVAITLAPGTKVTDAKYATYVTPKDIDFAASTGVTAYKVTGANGKIELEEVDAAPKGTPLVIAANEDTYVLTIAASAPAAVTGNLLKAADGNQTGDGAGNFYVLGKDNQGKVGFGPLGNGVTLAVGKAYIDGTEVTAKGFLPFVIGDEENSETTSISEELRVKSEESSAYNLAGQRVGKDYKGIVVVNGKKVIRK